MLSEKITISMEEYNRLLADSEFLANLRAAGVDNWEGYHYGYGDNPADGEEDIDDEDMSW